MNHCKRKFILKIYSKLFLYKFVEKVLVSLKDNSNNSLTALHNFNYQKKNVSSSHNFNCNALTLKQLYN